MDARLTNWLAALEQRSHDATTGVVVSRARTAPDGSTEYVLPALRLTLGVDAFWALIEEWADVVFFPADLGSDPEAEAYWALEDAVSAGVTLEGLMAENAGAPSVLEAAREAAEGADPVRAALAASFIRRGEEAEEAFWQPMRARADRLSL